MERLGHGRGALDHTRAGNDDPIVEEEQDAVVADGGNRVERIPDVQFGLVVARGPGAVDGPGLEDHIGAAREQLLGAGLHGLDLDVAEHVRPAGDVQHVVEEADTAVADGFTHVAFGDLFLEDVRKYREDRLAGTGLTPLFPVWGLPTPRLARDMIAGGLRATLATIDPRVMPRELIGAEFDDALLLALPPGIDPCGENGEFHTCVTAGPMFSRALDVASGETVEREGFLYGDLTLVRST